MSNRNKQSTKSKEYDLNPSSGSHLELNTDRHDQAAEVTRGNKQNIKTRNSIRKNMTIKIENVDDLTLPTHSKRIPKILGMSMLTNEI